MYTVTLYRDSKQYTAEFHTEHEALVYARTFWHLDPLVYDPDGNPVVKQCEYTDNEC